MIINWIRKIMGLRIDWKDEQFIEGYSKYIITPEGEVYSIRKGKRTKLKPRRTKKTVVAYDMISDEGKRTTKSLKKLMRDAYGYENFDTSKLVD